jgi:hypothetical protein
LLLHQLEQTERIEAEEECNRSIRLDPASESTSARKISSHAGEAIRDAVRAALGIEASPPPVRLYEREPMRYYAPEDDAALNDEPRHFWTEARPRPTLASIEDPKTASHSWLLPLTLELLRWWFRNPLPRTQLHVALGASVLIALGWLAGPQWAGLAASAAAVVSLTTLADGVCDLVGGLANSSACC